MAMDSIRCVHLRLSAVPIFRQNLQPRFQNLAAGQDFQVDGHRPKRHVAQTLGVDDFTRSFRVQTQGRRVGRTTRPGRASDARSPGV